MVLLMVPYDCGEEEAGTFVDWRRLTPCTGSRDMASTSPVSMRSLTTLKT